MRPTWILGLAVAVWSASAHAETGANWMLKLTLQGQTIEGMPLHWSEERVYLLGRDGRLWDFPPGEARDYRKTSNRFQSYSVSELRAILLRELGNRFDVSGTSHYLVAHPKGQRDQWAERFEDLYRSFVHYFSVRGFRLTEPPAPLVGIVCHDQAEFRRYSAKEGMMANGVLGYYSLENNRIVVYDIGGERGSASDWQETAATIIHEATHQIACNTGIHSRYTPPPLWVVEGLATLFEAPGVYDSRRYSQRSDRINQGRFRDFQKVIPRHRPDLLANLVATDKWFRTSPGAAYAEAWALTFYLVETQPRKFADYLARTAKREPFTDYSAEERTADFTAVFGADWRMLEAQFLRFMAGL
jgi:hypothetical protein